MQNLNYTCLSRAAGCLLALGLVAGLLACMTPGENDDPASRSFPAQFLGRSDYPVPGKMTYRPPRLLLEDEGVRVVFDLQNGKHYAHPAVILKLTLIGPAGERFTKEVHLGPLLARETKRVSTLVSDLDFEPTDLTVELLIKH